jgi:hypothetical protein
MLKNNKKYCSVVNRNGCFYVQVVHLPGEGERLNISLSTALDKKNISERFRTLMFNVK